MLQLSISFSTLPSIDPIWKDAAISADGMQRAIDHADAVSEKWSERAYIKLTHFLLCNDEFMCEDFRDYCSNHGLEEPPSKRAFGAIMCRAAKEGIIKQVGYGKVKNPDANKANAAVWKRVYFE